MALKTYGHIELKEGKWVITSLQPHVCIKLKAIFPKIAKDTSVPFVFKYTNEHCNDLKWFMERYPLDISRLDMDAMLDGLLDHRVEQDARERIMLPTYVPPIFYLNGDAKPRSYQVTAASLHKETKRLLLGDDLGLGKTLAAILTMMDSNKLPAIVVVQTHLTRQWSDEIRKFTQLTTHVIKGTRPYNFPVADIYIMKYSCLSGWVDVFKQVDFFKSVVFDEVQELRKSESNKYQAAKVLSENVNYTLGLSATPIYNFANEIFNVLDLLNPGCLGDYNDFSREWFFSGKSVREPKALGTYLRDFHLMLRRTRADVGMELPPINKIVHTVDYDYDTVKASESLAYALAMKVTSGSFMERGSAARELDMLMRQMTGVSKARYVAEYVKILLDNGEAVVLAGWHREVYEIWKEEFAGYNPVFYTGTENDKQKQASKEAFMKGETLLFIISVRSGVGLDGLQQVCSIVVVGELDWSPKVHEQLIARVDRPGQQKQVTAIYLVSEEGSDPVLMDLLGLKASQAHSIIDPLTAPVDSVSDESRIKLLAQNILNKRKH